MWWLSIYGPPSGNANTSLCTQTTKHVFGFSQKVDLVRTSACVYRVGWPWNKCSKTSAKFPNGAPPLKISLLTPFPALPIPSSIKPFMTTVGTWPAPHLAAMSKQFILI